MLRTACLTFLAVVFVPATVQAFDHHHHHHHHSSSGGGNGCGSAHDSSPSPSPSPSSSTSAKRVFVTSTTYAGALGGLDAADGFCRSSAAAGGLSGRYRAWLSSGTTNAVDRIASDGPWENVAGERVFASKAALREAPEADLLDETGAASNAAAWSGSDASGAAVGSDCAGWTDATDDASAATGSTRADDATWGGGSAPLRCSAKASLVCFED